MPARQRFPRTARIRRRAEYLRVQQQGRRAHTAHFAMLALPAGGQRRLGVTVTVRIGGAAVRNRIKRLVREVFRRDRELFPEGCDVVLVARSGAGELSYAQVRDEVRRGGEILRRGPRSEGASVAEN